MFCLALVVNAVLGAGSPQAHFISAKPVWPEGRERDKNLSVKFRAVVDIPKSERAVLRITASTLYRAFVDGKFLGHGPARAGHGYYRVDEWPLRANGRQVIVAVEVAGYNVNSYYLLEQPAFVQAEVVTGDTVLASTAGKGAPFEAAILTERVQKVQRFGYQRPFIEVYRIEEGHGRWRREPAAPFSTVACAVQNDKTPLPRRVPYPRLVKRPAIWHVAQGTLAPMADPDRGYKDPFMGQIGPALGGYVQEELEVIPSDELGRLDSSVTEHIDRPLGPEDALSVTENQFRIVDFGTNLTGFIGATVECTQPCRLMFAFDEILSKNDLNFHRLGCIQIVTYEFPAGTYEVESFEPYTLRYLKLLSLKGEATIRKPYLREYVNPDVWEAHFAASDPRLNKLFEAGRETLRQNALDVFMDCPSRERAGWLCDSFFTARTAFDLSGDTLVERNFYENYLLPEKFEHLPDGMLPMCYPSDHYNENFIPNWALWFVVQLREYVARSGDREMAEALEPKVMRLFEYFDQFRNEDGLLEKLEKWVFIEWSAANRFVQDVNYPSNMLYAEALDCAASLYGREDLAKEAERIREVIREQSFDGEFFVDNAERKDGKLNVTDNRTEVCQYFAFFFNVATPESHPELWRKLVEEFGPDRAKTGAYKDVHMANAFVGNMLRFELLSRYGRGAQILDESINYLLYMAERTGT